MLVEGADGELVGEGGDAEARDRVGGDRRTGGEGLDTLVEVAEIAKAGPRPASGEIPGRTGDLRHEKQRGEKKPDRRRRGAEEGIAAARLLPELAEQPGADDDRRRREADPDEQVREPREERREDKRAEYHGVEGDRRREEQPQGEVVSAPPPEEDGREEGEKAEGPRGAEEDDRIHHVEPVGEEQHALRVRVDRVGRRVVSREAHDEIGKVRRRGDRREEGEAPEHRSPPPGGGRQGADRDADGEEEDGRRRVRHVRPGRDEDRCGGEKQAFAPAASRPADEEAEEEEVPAPAERVAVGVRDEGVPPQSPVEEEEGEDRGDRPDRGAAGEEGARAEDGEKTDRARDRGDGGPDGQHVASSRHAVERAPQRMADPLADVARLDPAVRVVEGVGEDVARARHGADIREMVGRVARVEKGVAPRDHENDGGENRGEKDRRVDETDIGEGVAPLPHASRPGEEHDGGRDDPAEERSVEPEDRENEKNREGERRAEKRGDEHPPDASRVGEEAAREEPARQEDDVPGHEEEDGNVRKPRPGAESEGGEQNGRRHRQRGQDPSAAFAGAVAIVVVRAHIVLPPRLSGGRAILRADARKGNRESGGRSGPCVGAVDPVQYLPKDSRKEPTPYWNT